MPKKRTHEEYTKELFAKHGENISVLGIYVNSSTKILHKCNRCDNVWLTRPPELLVQKFGCKNCGYKERKSGIAFTSKQIKFLAKKVHGD